MIILKHKKTGKIISESKNEYIFTDQDDKHFSIPKWIVKESNDWEEYNFPKIIAFISLYPNENNRIIWYEGNKCIKTSDGFSIDNVKSFNDALVDTSVKIYQIETHDREIFTIGDLVNYKNISSKEWIINNFFLTEDKRILARNLDNTICEYVENLDKITSHLLITQDKVVITKDISLLSVVSISEMRVIGLLPYHLIKNRGYIDDNDKLFYSDNKKALQYIEDNKAKYSESYINQLTQSIEYLLTIKFICDLKHLKVTDVNNLLIEETIKSLKDNFYEKYKKAI